MEEKLFGHYRVVNELGRGGMGVVYRAYEESLNRYVAIKVLAEHLTEDQDFVTRFRREAQSAASLSHPNVTQIYYIGDEKGVPYFVMEFVEGPSIRDVLKKEGALEPARAARLGRQAASGLADAHDQGLVHRDIKPANLMLTKGDLVKIADFGLALQPDDAGTRLTATGMLMGTPGYLAPEQCEGTAADARSDIYSLGMTLYEMLAGTTPFEGNSPLAIIRQILYEEPPPLDELDSGVSAELNGIVTKMLAKDPAQRYQSCHEVISDLDSYLEGLSQSIGASGTSTAVMPPPLFVPPPPAAVPDSPPLSATIRVEEIRETTPDQPPAPPAAPADAAQAASSAATTIQPGEDANPQPEGVPQSGAYGAPARRVALVAVLLLLLAVGVAGTGLFLGKRVLSAWVGSRGSDQVAAEVSAGEALPATEKEELQVSEQTVEGAIEIATRAERQVAERTVQGPGAAADGAPHSALELANHVGEEATPVQEPIAVPNGIESRADGELAARHLPREPAANVGTTEVAQRRQPLPAVPRLVVLGIGEATLAAAAEEVLENELALRGFEIVDEHAMPEIRGLVGSGDVDLALIAPYLAINDVHSVVLAEAEFLGERELYYLGRRSFALTSELRVHGFLTGGQQALGPGWSERVEYTGLNVSEKADEALRAVGPELVAAIEGGWAMYREERGELR